MLCNVKGIKYFSVIMSNGLRAILLSAGLGTRLRPLTNKKPKCLMEINNVPILKIWIEKHYTLPEVYRLDIQGRKALFDLILDSNGGIQKIKLVRSSNNQVFDRLALKALEDSAPFPDPPAELVGRLIQIQY